MSKSILTAFVPHNERGFSMIEMMISATLFLGLSVASYQVMNTQRNSQMAALEQQKKTNASSVALDRFKADARMIDPSWSSLGLASIFPHQGYGFGGNAYLDETIRSNHGISDGVTFLRRHPKVDQTYQVSSISGANKYCVMKNQPLGTRWFLLNSVENVEEGDWMLVYQEGHQILAVVKGVNAALNRLQLDFPESSFMQETAVSTNSGSTHLTSFVTVPGVRPTDFDHTGLQTSTQRDDDWCMTTQNERTVAMQKIFPPVSYVMAYATNDGLEKSASNAYLLDSKGNKRTVLTRIEHDAINGIQREYIADVDQLALTFDIQTNDEGGMMRDVGRDTSKKGLLDIGMTQPESNEEEYFFTNSDILAMNLNAVLKLPDSKDPTRVLVKNHEVKATFDMIRGENIIAESMSVESELSNNLNILSNPDPNLLEQLGKPLYFVNDGGVGGEMLIPVSRMIFGDFSEIGQIKDLTDDGRIKILDQQGGNASNTLDSSIIFYSQIDGINKTKKTFYPSLIQSIEKADGSKILLVGGVSVTGEISETESGIIGMDSYKDSLTRNAGFGVVEVPAGVSVAQHLMSNNEERKIDGSGSSVNSCNVSGCHWIDLTLREGQLHAANLLDTANIAVSENNDILIVPMTKQGHHDSSFVYRMNNTAGELIPDDTEVVSQITESQNGSVVSAIADRTIRTDDGEFLPVCSTKIMPVCTDLKDPSTCSKVDPNHNMGEIRLVNVDAPEQMPSVLLANHNYACSSLALNENNDLIVSGRLTMHAIPSVSIKKALQIAIESGDPNIFSEYQGIDNQLLLDDVAMINEFGDKVYADGFIVDPASYGSGESQKVGWRGGASVAEFADGTFGVLSTNMVRMQGIGGDPVQELMNVGIHKVTLPSMEERVMVNIQTDTQNINNTRVIATYFRGGTFEEQPTTYIPGNYFINDQARTEATALPGVTAIMTNADWIDFYRDLKKPKGESINEDMPTLNLAGGQTVECESAMVDTCVY